MKRGANDSGRAAACMTGLALAFVLALAPLMGASAYAAMPDSAPALDAESMECVGCHKEKVSATDPPRACHAGGACDHPMANDYREAARKDPSLVNPDALDPAIRLTPDGRIGCATCHVQYTEYDHRMLAEKRKDMPAIPDPMLVVDNSKSGLCIACHRK